MSAAFLALLLLVAAPAVQSCSCSPDSFRATRPEAITNAYCSTYSSDIYSGVIVAASCNCIPPASGEVTITSALDCQQYQLNENGDSVSAAVVTRGMCGARVAYQEFYYNPGCSQLGAVIAGNLTVEMSPSSVEQTNLTDGRRCREACPSSQPDGFFVPTPCSYNVSITEVFKGRYSSGDIVTVMGPDVATTCGAYGRRLMLGTTYIAGIGGACGPIGEWTALSRYSAEEISLLRSFGGANPCATTAPGGTTTTTDTLEPVTGTMRPATGTMRPATGIMRPATGTMRPTMEPGVTMTDASTAGAARNMASAVGLVGSMLIATFLG